MKKAAELAKVSEYHATSYPAESSWFEQLLNQEEQGSYLDAQMQQMLGEYYEPLRFVKTISQRSAIQARLPYFLEMQ